MIKLHKDTRLFVFSNLSVKFLFDSKAQVKVQIENWCSEKIYDIYGVKKNIIGKYEYQISFSFLFLLFIWFNNAMNNFYYVDQ